MLMAIARATQYDKIDDEKRIRILFETLVLGIPLKIVSESLGLRYASAKNVIGIYKKDGRVTKLPPFKRLSRAQMREQKRASKSLKICLNLKEEDMNPPNLSFRLKDDGSESFCLEL